MNIGTIGNGAITKGEAKVNKEIQERLRALPGVDVILHILEERRSGLPGTVLKAAVRKVIDLAREAMIKDNAPCPSSKDLAAAALEEAARLNRPRFIRVVNGTGVVIHTNLGRSPLSHEAAGAIAELSRTYSNLEFDLGKGKRGSRYSLVEDLLKELTGADAAVVVNNNAAAVFLSLNSLAQGKEVVVSRGQLVEIGGSFRIPEVMAKSGSILREVGATNKTHLRDYANAVNENTAGLLKVHQSNFAMVGFSQVIGVDEMAELAHEKGLWLMEDLGSGCLVDLSAYGLPREPTVTEALEQGADVVTFSGDKLLGGPQAGVILGRAELLAKIKSNPINRAVRIDKMTLAGLEKVLRLYREPAEALAKIPTLWMLTASYSALSGRALRLRKTILETLAKAEAKGVAVRLVKGLSQVGGGSMPLAQLPTKLVGLEAEGVSASALERFFRDQETPIIGRIEKDLFMVDPRTLLPGDGVEIAQALVRLVRGGGK